MIQCRIPSVIHQWFATLIVEHQNFSRDTNHGIDLFLILASWSFEGVTICVCLLSHSRTIRKGAMLQRTQVSWALKLLIERKRAGWSSLQIQLQQCWNMRTWTDCRMGGCIHRIAYAIFSTTVSEEGHQTGNTQLQHSACMCLIQTRHQIAVCWT